MFYVVDCGHVSSHIVTDRVEDLEDGHAKGTYNSFYHFLIFTHIDYHNQCG